MSQLLVSQQLGQEALKGAGASRIGLNDIGNFPGAKRVNHQLIAQLLWRLRKAVAQPCLHSYEGFHHSTGKSGAAKNLGAKGIHLGAAAERFGVGIELVKGKTAQTKKLF